MQHVARGGHRCASTRLSQSLKPKPICHACQQLASSPSPRRPRSHFSSTSRSAAPANDDLPLTERLRRRIWGTSKPPGRADPYTPTPRRDPDQPPNAVALEERAQQLAGAADRPARSPSAAAEGGRAAAEREADVVDFEDEAQALQDAREYERERRRAAREARNQKVADAPKHPDYVPATTWEGLQTLGGEKEFPTGRQFVGFLPPKRLDTPEEITAAMYRAVVEVHCALAADRQPQTTIKYRVGPLLNDARHVRVAAGPAEQGEFQNVELTFRDDGVERRLLFPRVTRRSAAAQSAEEGAEQAAEDEAAASPAAQDAQEAQEAAQAATQAALEQPGDAPEKPWHPAEAVPNYTLASLREEIKSWGTEWLRISLLDPALKFAVVKRLTRILGATIPDSTLHTTAPTVGALLAALTAPPRAPRVADRAAQEGWWAGLPNVRAARRRQTPVDAERRLGRWKVIEARLRAEGLPVLSEGSSAARAEAEERQWEERWARRERLGGRPGRGAGGGEGEGRGVPGAGAGADAGAV